MDKKRFPILVVIALVAIVVAALLVFKRAPESEGSLAGSSLLPTLSDKLNEVERIGITGAGDQALVSIQRQGEGWTVVERDGYPADATKVRALLLKLADARVTESKTANPERYAQLGVEDVSAATAAGIKLTVEAAGDYRDSVIVGNPAGMSGGTYARGDGEQTSVLVGSELSVDREPGNWLQPGIIDVASSRIREIELAIGDGNPLRLTKGAASDDNFTVADVPRGRELQSDFVANGMGSMLTSLTLEDVARDSGDGDGGGETELHRAVYRLFDGIVINLTGWKAADEATWIRLSASLDEAAATAAVASEVAVEQADAELAAAAQAEAGDDDPDGSSEAAEAEAPVPVIDVAARTAERLAQLRAEVDAINATAEGWRFRIPSFKFDPINKRMDDMLQAAD